MRYLFGFVCVLALGVMGCSETAGTGGSGGSAGSGGMGGDGGTGGSNSAVFPCTEQGIVDAIAEGGGPHTFDCDGPQTVSIAADIVINNDVILDGEGNLTVDGSEVNFGPDEEHAIFSVPASVISELRGFVVTGLHGDGCGCFGIRNGGTLTVTDSTMSGNDGGIANNGTLIMKSCTVSGNIDPGGNDAGIENAGTLTMTDSTVSGNNDAGIENDGTLTMTNCTVSGNDGGWSAGGVRNFGTLTMTNCTVSGNSAEYHAGIENLGELTMTNCTVSGNDGGFCGGVCNFRTLTMTNSTVSGNIGGGLGNRDGTLTVTNTTVSGNAGGFGIRNGPKGTLTVANSLIDGDCDGIATSNRHNIESPGDTCGFDQTGDQPGVTEGQLALGPLQDNGGPTMTHALLTEPTVSVAIDVIPADDCVDAEGELLAADQRGEPRFVGLPFGPFEPVGDGCDVGAFEVQQ